MDEQNLIYICEICNKTSTQPEEMEEHVNMHSFTSDYAGLLAVKSYYSTQENELTEEEPQSDKLWNTQLTLFFIEKIKENDGKFDTDIKKFVWQKIAKLCSEFSKKDITSTQCDSKWRSLKRTYKKIVSHNNTSGKNRKHWEYFDVINEFMHKKPEINPVATCSSNMGLQVVSTLKLQEDKNETGSSSGSPASPNGEYESSFIRKRKLKQNSADTRHMEKMARLDKFNSLFEKFIDKMPDKEK